MPGKKLSRRSHVSGPKVRRGPAAQTAVGSPDIPAIALSKMFPIILVFAQTTSAIATFTYKDFANQLVKQYALRTTGTIPPAASTAISMFKYVKIHWIKCWGGIEKDSVDNFNMSLSPRGQIAPPSPAICDLASGTSDRAHAMINVDPELYWDLTTAATPAFNCVDTSVVHVKVSFWS